MALTNNGSVGSAACPFWQTEKALEHVRRHIFWEDAFFARPDFVHSQRNFKNSRIAREARRADRAKRLEIFFFFEMFSLVKISLKVMREK